MANNKGTYIEADKCSFCGLPITEVGVLFSGADGAAICDQCIERGYETLMDRQMAEEQLLREETKLQREDLMKPAEIKEFLDQYVIGQDDAKKTLAVAVYNHYKRLMHAEAETGKEDEVEIDKSNIIMVGETGTGKTLLARTIARMLHVPFTIVDATVLTEAGYVGEDVEGILTRLLQAADYNVPQAERGIGFFDEIAMLLEGTVVNVPPQGGRKHPDQKFIQVNTSNILFICGGAFDGIDKRISRRLNTHAVGYDTPDTAAFDNDRLLRYLTPQDLRAYGLIPEIIGRLPVLTHLDPLDRKALRMILTEPKNAIIKQYVKLFELDGVKLTFDDDVLDYIVDKAIEFKLGARGLRSICEAIMTDAMFETPSKNRKSLHIRLPYAKANVEKAELQHIRKAG